MEAHKRLGRVENAIELGSSLTMTSAFLLTLHLE